LIKGTGRSSTRGTDQHGGSRSRARSKPDGLGRYRGTRTCGLKGILSHLEAGSLTIVELIKVAET
jgi:hypothetical protein